MKTAIYARVSSETQAREGTIDSQIEALFDYAKKHDFEAREKLVNLLVNSVTLYPDKAIARLFSYE
jgi:DNA invertase Pin-like site-specific DNA recombinase